MVGCETATVERLRRGIAGDPPWTSETEGWSRRRGFELGRRWAAEKATAYELQSLLVHKISNGPECFQFNGQTFFREIIQPHRPGSRAVFDAGPFWSNEVGLTNKDMQTTLAGPLVEAFCEGALDVWEEVKPRIIE